MADSTEKILTQLLHQRILIMDGAMGTMIQGYGLGEEDFRGELFGDHSQELDRGAAMFKILAVSIDLVATLHRRPGMNLPEDRSRQLGAGLERDIVIDGLPHGIFAKQQLDGLCCYLTAGGFAVIPEGAKLPG